MVTFHQVMSCTIQLVCQKSMTTLNFCGTIMYIWQSLVREFTKFIRVYIWEDTNSHPLANKSMVLGIILPCPQQNTREWWIVRISLIIYVLGFVNSV